MMHLVTIGRKLAFFFLRVCMCVLVNVVWKSWKEYVGFYFHHYLIGYFSGYRCSPAHRV